MFIDTEMLNRKIKELMPLIKKIAYSQANRSHHSVHADDLMQEALLKILKSYRENSHFNDLLNRYSVSSKKKKDEGYIVTTIINAMKDSIRKNSFTPSSMIIQIKAVNKISRKISARTGKDATEKEIMEELGISISELMKIQEADQELCQYEKVSYLEITKQDEPSEALEREQKLARLNALIKSKLKPKEARILTLRTLEGLTTEEVAEALEIPEGTVKSSTSRSITKLRKSLKKAAA